MPSGEQRPLWRAVDQLRSHRQLDSGAGFAAKALGSPIAKTTARQPALEEESR